MATITGTFDQRLPLETVGAKGTPKQVFIIDTGNQYSPKAAFTLIGKNANLVDNLTPGDTVTVTFEPESREYKGRWYTENKAWKIEVNTTPATPPPTYAAPSTPAPRPAPAPTALPGDDDLPF